MVTIIRSPISTIQRMDTDTLRIVDTLDSDLTHYFEINIDEANNLVDFLAKIGDFRFKDIDDGDNSDALKIVCDDGGGSILPATSMITDGDVWKILASGTISGASATADITYLNLDLDSLVLNDGAANALDIQGHRIDFDGATLTAVSLSTLYGLNLIMPSIIGVPIANFAALVASDNMNTVYIANGSLGISGTGINDEKYYKCEDFDEEAAAITLEAGVRGDEWLSGGLNDSAANATYIQDQGGVLEIVTNGLDNDSHEITWLSSVVNTGSNPIIEFRVLIDSIGASLTGFFVGITETPDIQTISDISAVSDDYFLVGMDSDLATPADLRCWAEDNNAGQVLTQLTGIAIAATTWCTIRIDLSDTEQPRIFVNATGGAITPAHELDASLITQTIQDNIYVYPVIFVQGLDATPTARTLLIDYMKIWVERS